jgi:hypothetical protein
MQRLPVLTGPRVDYIEARPERLKQVKSLFEAFFVGKFVIFLR